MRYLVLFLTLAGVCFSGWFFIPGAYWTFQDGGIGFLYIQGEYEKFGWNADARYSFKSDYWLDTEFRAKLIGEMTSVRFDYSRDSLEEDWRRYLSDTSTMSEYIASEYSIYLRQFFNSGKTNKFSLYTGIKHGDYTSPLTFIPTSSTYDSTEEIRVADAIDIGGEFSIDSRDDPENPETAYYLKIRFGGLIFPSDKNTLFDYMDAEQLTDPDKEWPLKATGYIELDQRFYGKLQTKEVPFPLILAMRIAVGHHLTEVPQLVAFKAGRDNFLRGIDKRHLMGTSYYIMSGELRAQVWEESYTPWILLHWIIPGYENPRPILELAPFLEFAKVYGDYVRNDEQQMTIGLGLRWVFTDYTVVRYDFAYWPKGKTFGAYFSFEPSI
ncbi:BamA/TamA family outer membrane protein [bacterium]|nr:BamA/TamA family outer membrane protein [bacterium]